jgi:hypothetical protein
MGVDGVDVTKTIDDDPSLNEVNSAIAQNRLKLQNAMKVPAPAGYMVNVRRSATRSVAENISLSLKNGVSKFADLLFYSRLHYFSFSIYNPQFSGIVS